MRGVRYYKISLLIIVSVSSLLYGFCINIAAAKTQDIIISELMYDPEGPDSGYEWIELLNTSEASINLKDWQIQSAGTSFETVFKFESKTLAPGEILLIGESQVTNSDISVEKLGFQNGGSCTDAVRLIDSNNNIVDLVLYDDPDTNNLAYEGFEIQPDIKSGNTIAKIKTPFGNYHCYENVEPNPKEMSKSQIIAEFETESNYITNQEALFDASNSKSNISEIENYQWNVNCTNSSQVYGGKSISINFEEYGACSISLIVTDNLGFSSELSKNIQIINENSNIDISSIDSIKNNLHEDSEVTIQGIITTPKNLISEKEYYIQDSSSSIRLRSPEKDLSYNNTYRIKGEIDSVYGEIRIVAKQIDSINLDHEIDTSFKPYTSIDILAPGILTKVIGTADSIRGNYIYLKKSEQTSYQERVYIPQSLEIQDLKQYKDKTICVSGIISQYGTNSDLSPKLRIIPLNVNNIEEITTQNLLAETGQSIISYCIIGSLILLISRHLISHLLNSISN